ncbi:cyclic nucleotide-binding domain-containing protein [Pseudooceanicola spongiae]|jgi:CRP-like cAMP-binding protein|uniref:Cyclic nucleotide-binding domain-containing protein n=1 Tax=Pseudooceanicola spongiae TaxID=2613965 RepID=A0A7L9WNA6_9RHOB|nr:cyclic nucleotide-binding domain-containing protein [Pseudooceanicola spongiae]QOL81413.1 cyclic nucleotide-binding domain-containing protein [Pseudooceanicola spongiae]|tara:strand:- start:774 stop:1214 length:441 start_codon:yes stop_codon:yes gene_type:complete
MLLTDEVNLLSRVQLFSGVKGSKLKLLAFASDRVSFGPGQFMYRQGDNSDYAYVILSGVVEMMTETDDGLVTFEEKSTQDVVGEGAILSERPRQYSVRAKTPIETLRIKRSFFQQLLSCCPHTMAQIMRVLSDRDAKIADMASATH